MTTEHDLMRHLLVDLPAGDRRHILEVVDRNHAEQLRQKRWSLRPGALGEQDVANDDLEADDPEADDPEADQGAAEDLGTRDPSRAADGQLARDETSTT